MGFIVTAPTDLPLNPDGTFDRATWGESGLPFTVPGAQGPGVIATAILPANTVNYPQREIARWSRSTVDRTVLSDEGLFTSCVVRQGTWNKGGGTLNITLTPTRLVVDLDLDGGVVLELTAAPGSPEPLPALSDSYVDIKEDGTVTVASVANGNPEPALTADSVRLYLLVTDATELTSADIYDGIAPFPCLASVGALAFITENLTIPDGGTLTVGDGGTIALGSGVTFTGQITATGQVEAAGFQGPGSTSAVMSEGATIPNGEDLDLVGSATIAGVGTTVATLGYLEFIAPASPPAVRQLSTNAVNQVTWNPGPGPFDGELVHYSPNGWMYATGDQEAETLLAAVQLVATTTVAIKGLIGVGTVRVIVEGQVQVSALGSTFDVDVQENQTANPAYTDIGAAQQITALKDTSDANDWQSFRHERVFNSGITTATLYQCKVTKNGGGTLKVKEVRLRVVGERA